MVLKDLRNYSEAPIPLNINIWFKKKKAPHGNTGNMFNREGMI